MKPFVIEAKKAHREGIIKYKKNGSAEIRVNREEGKGKSVTVPLENQYDLTQATIFGLNERLTLAATSPRMKDGTLRDLFDKEWKRYEEALRQAQGKINQQIDFGYYAYYPHRNHLVRFCDPYWHRVVSVASNSMLVTDPAGKMSWQEIQDRFAKATIAVVGCSVGNNISHAIVQDIRPKALRIADKSLYKMENVNRVRLTYADLVEPMRTSKIPAFAGMTGGGGLRNKAEVTADQLWANDPFLKIDIFPEGVTEKNIKKFLKGVDVVIEEADDPRVKIFVREYARAMGIPLIMATDIGSAVQIDIARYDKSKKLPLAYGKTDKEVHAVVNRFYDNPTSRATFFEFVDMLIGKDYRTDELKLILEQKTEIPTSTIIPQLGSTVLMAGAVVAETVARILLGYEYPARFLINKKTLKVKSQKAKVKNAIQK